MPLISSECNHLLIEFLWFSRTVPFNLTDVPIADGYGENPWQRSVPLDGRAEEDDRYLALLEPGDGLAEGRELLSFPAPGEKNRIHMMM